MRSMALILAAFIAEARAEAPDVEELRTRGRELSENARRAFKGGQYEEAARLYLEAFELAKQGGLGEKPQLLYNAALAYERSARCDRVADVLTEYSRVAPKEAPAVAGRLQEAARCAPLVLVQSDPAGADVSIDGEPRGKTPLELRLVAGLHRLGLERVGFTRVDLPLTVDRGVSRTVTLRLTPATRMVNFEIPDGHVVAVDDRTIGTGPAAIDEMLAIGEHRVRITAPDCAAAELKLNVEPSPDPLQYRAEIPGCVPRSMAITAPAPPPVATLQPWPIVTGGVAGAGAIAAAVLGVLTKTAIDRRNSEVDKGLGAGDLFAVRDAESDARSFAIGAYAAGAVAVTGLAITVVLVVLEPDESSAEVAAWP
jgi:hypothetical protein